MRFATYNIRHGEDVTGWISNAAIARTIAEIRPAVVGLNEVWRLGRLYDQPTSLGEMLHMAAEFCRTEKWGPLQQGNAILACGRIAHVERIDLPRHWERRACLLAEIEADGTSLWFATTHLSLHGPTRARQLSLLAEKLPADRPLVLAGDFNCGPGELAPLRKLLTFAEPRNTYPSTRPVRPLDYLGFSSHWRLVATDVPRSLASDHRPLVADLELS